MPVGSVIIFFVICQHIGCVITMSGQMDKQKRVCDLCFKFAYQRMNICENCKKTICCYCSKDATFGVKKCVTMYTYWCCSRKCADGIYGS